MKCSVCKELLSDPYVFFGKHRKCTTCNIEYLFDNEDSIRGWGLTKGDLSLFGEKADDEVKVWRSGSGGAFLHKQKYQLPDQKLLSLFNEYIENKIN